MSKIFEFMTPYIGFILITIALIFVEAMCALFLPGLMADIVNDGVLPGYLPVIWSTGFTMLALTVLSMVMAIGAGFFIAKTSAGLAHDLREAVFTKVLGFSKAEVGKFSTSSLITRTTNDITQVQDTLMMALRLFIYAPIIGVGGIMRALDRSGSMTWIVAVASIAMVVSMGILFTVVLPKFNRLQGLIDRLNLVSRENLSGILVVRAFSTQKFEKDRFDVANKELADTSRFIDTSFAFMMPAIMLIMNLTTTIIVWVGARHVSEFSIDIGDIFAFLQYGMLIIFSFLMVSIMMVYLPRMVVSANRIKEVLESESSMEIKSDPIRLPKDFKGIIEFRSVDFRYPDALETDDNVLTDISFTAKPGETTAIIGATGEGKTTVLQLLLRFYDVTGGGIFVDGLNIKDIHKEDLHSNIGYIPQKSLLFTGDIQSNLIYADKEASQETIDKAVEISQSKAFIEDKPEKYESSVAQGGSNFSGGQRQRLSIARALVKDTQVYLFDDSFSALDVKTDAQLRDALKKQTGNSTMIVVAQRITSIMDAEQIVVLDQGHVVGKGTHKELMKDCKVYQEIAASQLSEEEANQSRAGTLN